MMRIFISSLNMESWDPIQNHLSRLKAMKGPNQQCLHLEKMLINLPQVYVGHRNCVTVKGVTFIGPNHEYVASVSDCGRLLIWRKKDGKFLRAMEGDDCIVNCIEPHPHAMTMASSGIDKDVKIWTPSATELAQVVNVEELKPRKRRAKLWPFALAEQLIWHVLASRRRRRAAGEDSSEDLEDNTELLNLVLRAVDRDVLSDEDETSDGSGDCRVN